VETAPFDLLEGLDPAQQAAVLSPGSPLCIIAGAGSGKTTVLTRRIVRRVTDGSADSAHVLALTFTRQAAGELVRRLSRFGLQDRPTVGTFHGVAYSVLRQRWEDQGRRPPTLLTSRITVVRGLASVGTSAANVAEIVAEIDWSRARRITPDRYIAQATKAARRTNLSLDRIAAAFTAYEAEKTKRGLIDFDDLLEQCLRTIERDRQFAEVQRWRFRHIFVDEFQDINPLQMKLLEMWRGGRGDLCIVGDPNQAIYGWNGADPSFLRNAEKLFPGLTVVRLTANYRSTPEIIAAGQHVLGDDATSVITTRAEGGLPALHAFPSDAAEADGIAGILSLARRPGQRWASCAVLTRTNGQLIAIARQLQAAGIPVRSRLATSQLTHPAVRSAIADSSEFAGRTGVRDWIAEVQFKLADPDASIDEDARTALERLVVATYEHMDSEPFATHQSLRLSLAGENSQGDGVELLTFHAAKGREWHTVVVAGLERGLVPHASADTPAALAEETRLLYVALTRATQTLHGTWAKTREGYRAGRKRSPLVDGMLTDTAPAAPPPPDIRRASTPPDPLLLALQTWRAQRARAAAVHPTFILSDQAVAALAAVRPQTADDLAVVADLSPAALHHFGPQLLDILKPA
jgi:DNA helicase II / ATP-dependent DNA helicase PcrA